MKAFLMYPDRDFDPDQLLVRRERELHHNRAMRRGETEKQLSLEPVLPWNAFALRQDLGLDHIILAMANNDDAVLADVAMVALLTSLTDRDVLRYRQDILADSLEQSETVRAMYQIAVDAIISERKNYWGSSFMRYPAGTLHRAVEVLEAFVAQLRLLRGIADEAEGRFKSKGFLRFFAMLKAELSDDYFAVIEAHLKRLRFKGGTLISAQLGSGNQGIHYVLRRPHDDPRNWLMRLLGPKPPGFTYQLHPRDEAGAHALSRLNDQGVNLVANALAQSTDHILSFFQMLRTELAFYVGCLNLGERLGAIGEGFCLPSPAPVESRILSFTGLYDIALALNMGKKIVGNDLNGNPKDLVVITGANTGGKSTFLRSVGQAQLMMQAGMFVPAEKFTAEVCASIVTHHKREEDTSMESGKWDEELSRMSAIVDRIGPDAMVLFNESFASTNEREGSEIAGQIVHALLARRVKILFVTHLYHFARALFDEDADRSVFLRAERRPDGTRPYKLVEGEPLETSYGEDLYASIFLRTEQRSQAETVPTG
jgi:MutS domain V